MKVLISGNHGFIGSHLHKTLEGLGHKVVGIDNFSHPSKNHVKSEYCDVRSYKDLLPYFPNCDVVFHLAAQISVDRSIERPQETIDTNILGTQNVLEAARRFGVKVVFASSSEVYGSAQDDFMNEHHPLDASHPYGASKVAADRMCLAYIKTYGLDVFIVRNFNTFGEYQTDDSYGGVIAKFTKAALNNEPLFIYGDGTQERDYMHISDAMQAYQIAMWRESDKPVNFGTGKTIQILDLANKIKEMTNSNSKIIHEAPRKGEVQRLCADISYARKIFDFEPQTDFWPDLEGYIKWKKE